jgi:hypothetical protein
MRLGRPHRNAVVFMLSAPGAARFPVNKKYEEFQMSGLSFERTPIPIAGEAYSPTKAFLNPFC